MRSPDIYIHNFVQVSPKKVSKLPIILEYGITPLSGGEYRTRRSSPRIQQTLLLLIKFLLSFIFKWFMLTELRFCRVWRGCRDKIWPSCDWYFWTRWRALRRARIAHWQWPNLCLTYTWSWVCKEIVSSSIRLSGETYMPAVEEFQRLVVFQDAWENLARLR